MLRIIPNVIDIIITSIIFFILFFCWLNFYIKNTILSVFLGVFLTFLIVFFLFFFKSKRNKRKNFSSKKQKEATDCAVQLKFSDELEVKKYFKKILKNDYSVKTIKSGLLLEKENIKILFVMNFGQEIFNIDNLAKTFAQAKNLNVNEIIIVANAFDEKCKSLANAIKEIKISIFDAFDTYEKFIEPSKIFPNKVIDTSKAKLSFKQVINYAFSKERTKHYLLFGLILIISSFFVYFKVYYLVFGSILLVFALLTRILPKFKKEQK